MATIDFYDSRGVDYFTDSSGRSLSEEKEERESDEDPWARPAAPRKLYTPQVAVKLPPPPCNVGRLCSLPRFHLGHCNTEEKLELLTMKKGR